MCGIFGFSLKRNVSVSKAMKVLERLEVHKYPNEPTPVGGFGAGVAILTDDGSVVSEKVGKVSDSPAKTLANMVKVDNASVLVGHVRMPSPEFMARAKFKETAQPYVEQFGPDLTVASVHNGMVENYKELRGRLGKDHVFESEKVELIDSEVIPHLFAETLNEVEELDDALYTLLGTLQGPNAIAMLHLDEENTFLHLLHKGKTRGLIVWTNDRNEVVFCSRKRPLMEEFKDLLAAGRFRQKVSIGYREDVGLKLSFTVE